MFHTFHTSLIVFPPRSNLWATAFVPGKEKGCEQHIDLRSSKSILNFIPFIFHSVHISDGLILHSTYFLTFLDGSETLKSHVTKSSLTLAQWIPRHKYLRFWPCHILYWIPKGYFRPTEPQIQQKVHRFTSQNAQSFAPKMRASLAAVALPVWRLYECSKKNGVAVHGKTALEENP